MAWWPVEGPGARRGRVAASAGGDTRADVGDVSAEEWLADAGI